MHRRNDVGPELELLESLVSPFGPVVAVGALTTVPRRGLDRLAEIGVAIGSGSPGKHILGSGITAVIAGGGKAVDDRDRARLVAIAEGAERYAAGDFLGEPRVSASVGEMDGPTLDLSRVPRCSERELRNPGCPLRPLDPHSPMRWVQGVDLIGGGPVWVPAVMASYGVRPAMPSERFWCGISTGFAVHFDPLEALVRAICEVVERDINSILWLQRLKLPIVSSSQLSPATEYLLDWSNRHFVDTYLFDATTDIGVPTVYCLQAAEYDDRARHVVGAGAGRDITSAAEKALVEATGARILFYSETEIREDFSKFTGVMDGARYMARPQMAEAFGFLIEGAHERIGPERTPLPSDPGEALSALVETLSRKGMQVVAIDRTPRELAAVGLTAVNVVIPDLQPLTLRPLAQYLAHPRLYEAPTLMGYPSHTEEDLNPWPQPFL
jgi:ribosomal protein S12 methylthiotransferase accessory factor